MRAQARHSGNAFSLQPGTVALRLQQQQQAAAAAQHSSDPIGSDRLGAFDAGSDRRAAARTRELTMCAGGARTQAIPRQRRAWPPSPTTASPSGARSPSGAAFPERGAFPERAAFPEWAACPN